MHKSRDYEYRPGTHSYRTFVSGQVEFETFNLYDEIEIDTHGPVTLNIKAALALRNALDVWLIGKNERDKR
jgi:hypothetical protein